MATVFIGIGSNLGEREHNCLEAIRLLSENGVALVKRSALFNTEPWGVADQPDFINMAIEVATDLEPEELLSVLHKIELDMGRTRTVRWGPRVIDLDLLFYGNLVIETEGLTLPHPELHNRLFVLEPLAEIAQDFVHPLLGRSIKEMLEAMHDKDN